MEDVDPLIVASDEEALRLDILLKNRFPDQSRTYFQHLIEHHLVLVNGQPVKKREKLKAGDEIEVEFALTQELHVEPQNIPLDVVYEDADLLVVNKKAGMVVHPAPGNWTHTFVNALLYHCSHIASLGSTLRPGIVHRLDKETSGLIVAAKTLLAHQKLVEAFASRTVHKEYIAICIGNPKKEKIEMPISRNPRKRKEMWVNENGKAAITYCYPLLSLGPLSLVQFVLETGRTHQIRVHMKFKSCPILGDSTYGNTAINKKYKVDRQLLHAHRLTFLHPIKNIPLSCEAPIPEDFKPFLKNRNISC